MDIIKSNISQINPQFTRYINSQKLLQAFVIFVVALVFTGYFLGIFFLIQKYMDSIISSLQDISTIYERKICAENILHAMTEEIINSNSGVYYIFDDKVDIF